MGEYEIIHVPNDFPALQFETVRGTPEMGRVVWVRGYIFGAHGDHRLAVMMPEGMGVYSVSRDDIAVETDD